MNLVRAATGLLALPGGTIWIWLGTPYATGVYSILLFVWVFFSPRPRRLLLYSVLLAAISSDLLCARVLKPLFSRPRPCAVEHLDVPDCSSSFSMPSSHASNTMAVATAMASPPLAALSLLVGASRVVLGLHYPGDVAAGWGVGAVIGALARLGVQRWRSKQSS